jgi:hypothetical protein
VAALHLAYIEREGVERGGSSGRVYGPAEIVDVRESLSAPLEVGDPRARRVSDEPGNEMGLSFL